MTEDNRFSNREIQLMFKNIEHILREIREDIKNANDFSEKRFVQIEKEVALIKAEVDALKSFKVRVLTAWGLGVTAVTLIINKFV